MGLSRGKLLSGKLYRTALFGILNNIPSNAQVFLPGRLLLAQQARAAQFTSRSTPIVLVSTGRATSLINNARNINVVQSYRAVSTISNNHLRGDVFIQKPRASLGKPSYRSAILAVNTRHVSVSIPPRNIKYVSNKRGTS